MLDDRGNMRDPDSELATSIRIVGGGNDLAAIMRWAQSSDAAHYRHAYALNRQGWERRSTVEEQRDLGQSFPWGVNSAMRAYEQLDPSFSSGPVVGDGGNIPGDRPVTTTEAEEFFSSPEFGSERVNTLDFLEGLDNDTRARLHQANMNDDPAEIAESFMRSARAYEEAGNEEQAQFFRERAEAVEQFPERYLMARDSVWLPTMEYLNRNN